jgi:hypothetical protein
MHSVCDGVIDICLETCTPQVSNCMNGAVPHVLVVDLDLAPQGSDAGLLCRREDLSKLVQLSPRSL